MKKVYYICLLILALIPALFHGDSLKVIANPSQRSYAFMVTDVSNNRCLLFGGGLPWFKFHNDVWSLDVMDETWHPLSPSGTQPQPRFMGAAVYYQPQNEMLIIGGRTDNTYFNDVWQLILTPGNESWHLVSTSGSAPTSRSSYSCIVDSLNSRVIVFGGEHEGSYFNSVYSLNLNTWIWSQLSPSGTAPSPRFEHSAIYDPQGQRMIVFGGYDGVHYSDVWAMSLTPGSESWSQLFPTGNQPTPRGRHFSTYDPLHHAVIIGFGYDGGSLYDDVWALDLNTLSWSCIVPSSQGIDGRRGAVSACAPAVQKIIVFGGDFFTYYSAETYALMLNTLGIGYDRIKSIHPHRLLSIQQNPIQYTCAIVLNLSPGLIVTVQIFDNIGNLIKTVCDNKTITQINERMDWDCTDSQGRRVPAGIYFVKARTSELAEDQKVIILNPK
jgi:hypothetical protein